MNFLGKTKTCNYIRTGDAMKTFKGCNLEP